MSPGPDVIKLFSCSTQLSTKFLKAHKYKNVKIFGFLCSVKPRMLFFPLRHVKMPQLSWASKKFYNLGARTFNTINTVITKSVLKFKQFRYTIQECDADKLLVFCFFVFDSHCALHFYPQPANSLRFWWTCKLEIVCLYRWLVSSYNCYLSNT